ncbi:hypothetical protein L218DRAFT_952778 [Marasmius fiardii PR-910]|nr:hypothetical protein L218DRAFT_952778 [Marasmius fiardii PR-910]
MNKSAIPTTTGNVMHGYCCTGLCQSSARKPDGLIDSTRVIKLNHRHHRKKCQ